MSRRVFASVVLLFLVIMMCCSGVATAQVGSNADASTPGSALTGAIATEGSASGGVEGLQRVDLFMPQTTQVLAKNGPDSSRRDSFVSPSLVSAGGVIAAFAEGHVNAKYQGAQLTKPLSSDVVAENIDSAWEWPTLVGEVTNATGGEPSKRIKWGEIQSLLNESAIAAHKGNLTECLASGGSGVVMEDGTIVFSLMAMNEKNDGVYSMIIYSTNNDSTWSLSEDISSAECLNPASPNGTRDRFS
ncbi:trans-sialidase [Trypanosoma cruzi]|nr:trans-sialidase [Trypanosoma cruzi]